MDAVRLIVTSRRALAGSGEAPQTMAEAWQAQALAQAIGSRLAVAGPPELRGEALGLTELAGRGCGVLDRPDVPDTDLRAAQLTELGDARQALMYLGGLLGEVGIALVGIASSAGDEATYWQCMEAIDAADESRDRVLEMLRRLTDRDLGEALPEREAG
ncbi:DUF6099 family protein [Streptomyces sp. NBC_00457]|uniref:DUF6099 family protein n=1 Tax=unclassified Streptomyces TaxID=2593676 RepID=UPI002E1B7E83|nr:MULTISPECIES: DUF6099 family protein [unclassified Streptomyces]